MPAPAATSSNTAPKIESRVKPKTAPTAKRPTSGAREDEQAARRQAPTAVQTVEPEDAYLTGVSRSLQRRLLGLNVEGARGQSKPHPEAIAAGLHATGSFTGAKHAPTTTASKGAKKSAKS